MKHEFGRITLPNNPECPVEQRPQFDIVEQTAPYQSPEAYRLEMAAKPEFGILTATLLDFVVQNAVPVRELAPLGLIGTRKNKSTTHGLPAYTRASPSVPLTYGELEQRMEGTLHTIIEDSIIFSITNERADMTEEEQRLHRIYRRYVKHVDFQKRNINMDVTPIGLLKNGAGTAEEVIPYMLQVIPAIFAPDGRFDAKALGTIADNSFSTIANMAFTEVEALNKFILFLKGDNPTGPFDPRYFMKNGSDHCPKVIFTSEAKAAYKELFHKEVAERGEERILIPGCFGMVNFADRPNIVKFTWDWNSEIAKKMYEKQVR